MLFNYLRILQSVSFQNAFAVYVTFYSLTFRILFVLIYHTSNSHIHIKRIF